MEFKHDFGVREKPMDETLQAARKIIHPKTGIVKNLGRILFFNDEPKICTFVANLCDTSVFSDCYKQDEITGGVSFDSKIAELRALAEAMERYCSAIYKEKDFVIAAHKDIERDAVNPVEFRKFSVKQLSRPQFKICRFDEKTEFRWTEAYSFFKRKNIMVPAQLVYVPYSFRKERIIRLPISTGSACGITYSGAIYRGLCEVVERDAFMIYYLNKMPAAEVDLEASENDAIGKLVSAYRRYRLEIRVFDITTDIQIPVFLGILVDRTGKGPAITVGAKAGLDAEKTIIGAMEEAYLTRPWIRELLLKPDERISERNELLDDIDKRGIFWSKRNMIKHLDFLLKSKETKSVNEYKKVGKKNMLEVCFSFLKKMDVFFRDLTTPEIREIGFKVVKILIPQMHPLHLNEEYKYLGGERLYSVPETLGFHRKRGGELNRIPHPFL
ncbi:MAG: YcaO-like family protein [Candidatus Aenigmarchaeota archaeon]|nr:YcaO-like family protein [Candidatus Aenigmarchaeota archaeon]